MACMTKWLNGGPIETWNGQHKWPLCLFQVYKRAMIYTSDTRLWHNDLYPPHTCRCWSPANDSYQQGTLLELFFSQWEPLVATNAGSLRSLVANTNECGEGISLYIACTITHIDISCYRQVHVTCTNNPLSNCRDSSQAACMLDSFWAFWSDSRFLKCKVEIGPSSIYGLINNFKFNKTSGNGVKAQQNPSMQVLFN